MPRTTTSALDAKLIGETLRQTRQFEGLTQAELAVRLGVSPSYVQKLEAGRANPTIGQMAHLAKALGRDLKVDFVPSAKPTDDLVAFADR
ncbi:MAG TPA: helix-turn-helix transcriptional regulator [Solirubrobacterales bacterium]|nr:helix-turn-helix transcriptional regulator [Solirubrobacterales bacterium]